MPTRIAAKVAYAADTTLPRDYVVNTLHFNHTMELIEGAPDWQTLANDLRDVFNNFGTQGLRHHKVTLYNLADARPRLPRATSEANVGAAPATMTPRELAICLSFFAGSNRARNRGRVYIPAWYIGAALGLRPNLTARDKVMTLADSLSALGGVNVDWCVFSRTDGVLRKVTHAWVDDEWDVQRRRGLRATARSERDVSG